MKFFSDKVRLLVHNDVNPQILLDAKPVGLFASLNYIVLSPDGEPLFLYAFKRIEPPRFSKLLVQILFCLLNQTIDVIPNFLHNRFKHISDGSETNLSVNNCFAVVAVAPILFSPTYSSPILFAKQKARLSPGFLIACD